MKMFSLVATLIVALAMTLVAGCGSGSDNSSPTTLAPTANYSIAVYDAGNSSTQDIQQDYDGTGWSACPGRLWFTIHVAGTKGFDPAEVDFQLWKSSEPQNFDSAADLETFAQKVADLPNGTDPSYMFDDLGRYLIRAYYKGTKQEAGHCHLDINPYYPPNNGG